MSIGARIRQLREHHNLSGEKFGELCGVTKGMVSQWESDTSTPPTDRLRELKKHLSFSLDWLIDGVGEMEQCAISKDDYEAIRINRALGVRERAAWYRAGDALVEPPKHNGTQ